mgnify:FL=1
MLFYLCPDLTGSSVRVAYFSDCNFLVGNYDSGVGCYTPSTSVLLLSFGRSRESNLDRTDLLVIHSVETDLPVGTDHPLVIDRRVAQDVVPVLLAS